MDHYPLLGFIWVFTSLCGLFNFIFTFNKGWLDRAYNGAFLIFTMTLSALFFAKSEHAMTANLVLTSLIVLFCPLYIWHYIDRSRKNNPKIEREFDNMGRLAYFKDLDGTVTRWGYFKFGSQAHITHPNGFETWNTFNNNGDLVHESNSNGNEASYEYDVSNRLVLVKACGGRVWDVDPMTGVATLRQE